MIREDAHKRKFRMRMRKETPPVDRCNLKISREAPPPVGEMLSKTVQVP